MLTSAKQDRSYCEANHAFNIWVGAVRSGKTFSSTRRFIHELQHGPKGDAMIAGVNRGAIDRNVITPLYNMLGFPVPSPKTMKTKLYGRDLYFVGAPDVGAVSTIQGCTLAMAYVDEATCIPEPFWKMLESRLSVPGAKLFATCNPDAPAHYIKKNYIDRAEELDVKFWNFTLEDNPTLDEDYKKRIKASYTGLWHKRFILGEWALAVGAIYDTFDHFNEYTKPYSPPAYYVVGIDYGTTNPTAAVLLAVNPRMWPQLRVEAEYYYDSAKTGRSKTDAELVKDIEEFIQYKNVSAVYVDPAAASFKIALRQANIPVLDANNDVLLGIKTVNKFVSGKNLVIHKSCKTLIEQMQSYSWCPKASANGDDKPIKKDDHICDATRYALTPYMLSGDFGNPDDDITHEQLRRKVFGGDDGYGFMNPAMGGGYQ